MHEMIKKAMDIWPETNESEWSLRGGCAVHAVAKISVPDTNLVSGIIRSGQVYGNARVSGNARVYGDAWEISPIYIQGSRHALTTCTHDKIRIGCEEYSHEEWLEKYSVIGQKNNYSVAEIEEYGILIRAAILALVARQVGVK